MEAKWVLSFFNIRGDRQSLARDLWPLNKQEMRPTQKNSIAPTTRRLFTQIWRQPLCARHAAVHFKCSTNTSSSHQLWRGLPSWKTLARIRENTPYCQMPRQQHGSCCVQVLSWGPGEGGGDKAVSQGPQFPNLILGPKASHIFCSPNVCSQKAAPQTPAHWWQRQTDFHEFKASLFYIVSSRTAKPT